MEEYARIKCEMAEGLYFVNESLKKEPEGSFITQMQLQELNP